MYVCTDKQWHCRYCRYLVGGDCRYLHPIYAQKVVARTRHLSGSFSCMNPMSANRNAIISYLYINYVIKADM